MRLIAIAILIFVSFQGCIFSNCEKVELSSNDRSWMNAYSLGDSLLFESNLSTIDTFLITYHASFFSDCNKFEKGPLQYEESAIRAVKINQTVKDDHYSCGFYFRQTKEFQVTKEEISSKKLNVFDFNTKSFHELKNKASEVFIQTQYHKGEKLGYLFENKDTNRRRPCTNRVSSFVWSKHYGLLQFELESGEKFTLLDKRN